MSLGKDPTHSNPSNRDRGRNKRFIAQNRDMNQNKETPYSPEKKIYKVAVLTRVVAPHLEQPTTATYRGKGERCPDKEYEWPCTKRLTPFSFRFSELGLVMFPLYPLAGPVIFYCGGASFRTEKGLPSAAPLCTNWCNLLKDIFFFGWCNSRTLTAWSGKARV